MPFCSGLNEIDMSKAKPQPPVFELNQSPQSDEPSKIEVIKNLIFGEQIQVYETEFEALKKDILAKKEALDELIEEVRGELKQSIDSVSADLNHRITDLEKNLEGKFKKVGSDHIDKKALGEMLKDLGDRIAKE